jgi:hypothetical protein
MTFTRREGNKVAHALAKWASRNNVTQQWLCTTPECIHEIVRKELPAPFPLDFINEKVCFIKIIIIIIINAIND